MCSLFFGLKPLYRAYTLGPNFFETERTWSGRLGQLTIELGSKLLYTQAHASLHAQEFDFTRIH